ncbi:MAG TPA: glycosyltransferase family 2 protein, partial [Devosia sp.]|nr:glycosyltransferase family 2 protein [Devosia sp.]
TYSIAEPVYVAMEPLAVWAENAEQTTRNAELKAGYLRRELDVKRAVQALRQKVWTETSTEQRAAFLTNPRFAAPMAVRATHLAKALIGQRLDGHVSPLDALRLRARGVMIRALGRVTPDFNRFVASRGGSRLPLPRA